MFVCFSWGMSSIGDLLIFKGFPCPWIEFNTYHAVIGWSKLEFLKKSKAISRITEPILGMFVLIWLHFPCWFQKLQCHSTFFDFCCWFFWFFLVTFWTRRLLTPATWYNVKGFPWTWIEFFLYSYWLRGSNSCALRYWSLWRGSRLSTVSSPFKWHTIKTEYAV